MVHVYKDRKGDLVWGRFDYSVTRTQKATLDGIWNLFRSLPRGYDSPDDGSPQGGFYSQNPSTGAVIVGLNHRSVTVHRTGRITSNQ